MIGFKDSNKYFFFNLIYSFETAVFHKNYSCFISTSADSGFFKNFLYQGGVKATDSGVVEDLKFKISEGHDQNWCFPDSAQLAVSV